MKDALFVILFILIIALPFCNSESSKSKKNEDVKLDQTDYSVGSILKINNRLFNVPSPISEALFIKKHGIKFNKELLNKPNKSSGYTTNLKKALNLGVYGANLGYINIYEQYPEITYYFAVIRQLLKDIGLNNTVNDELIKKLEKNNTNKDSLMFIISGMYRDIDSYLINNERNEIGVFILTGGWVESLYLLTQSLKQYKNQELINRIGEQKNSLENLIDLLRPYYNKHSELLDICILKLVDLASIYDGVIIEYNFIEPKTQIDNKLTIINSTSKAIINEYQLRSISDSIDVLRKLIIE